MTVDIKRLTAHLSQPQQDEIAKTYKKQAENETAAFLWCFFLGWMGAHRFYLHQWGQAILRLIIALIAIGVIVAGIVFQLDPTLVVLVALPFAMVALIWEIIDLFRIDDEVSARNLRLAETIIAGTMLADRTVEQQAQAKLDEVVHHVAAESQPEPATNEAATAAEATGAAAPAVSERYEAMTTTRASDDPNATKDEEKPVQPGTHDWSETETVSTDESGDGAGLAAGAAVAGAAGVAGVAAAEALHMEETTTHAHTESGYSATDSVDTVMKESAEPAVEPAPEAAIAADMTPITAAEADAPTWPDHPPIAEAAETAESAPPDNGAFVPLAPALDVTDMGDTGYTAPVADVGTAGATPQMVYLGDEAAATPVAEAVAPAAAPVAAAGPITTPPESYIPPTVPVIDAPVAEAEPVVPVAEAPAAAPETLAELAGLAAAGAGVAGVAAAAEAPAAEPEVAHTEEIEQTHHMLKRIRVTRQIKVNGEVMEETSAEELIDADADPEPVRQRLREQLHHQAAARMAELGITPDPDEA